ncbi:DUF2993 domain-containing protein [Streptomyces sp. WAC06614]|uniref:DUF2993 domain-containing protein n=1 Tax=Streptomyces sp. WAC06614 TaxID=2487416 RepID=UPI000F772019|nr:DUF2993 domain-containing protein [Streptomyces sp. WAC06614]RSS81937.1 DUF2993 domain-containing protein [Streptomyces sp. WAC06614]
MRRRGPALWLSGAAAGLALLAGTAEYGATRVVEGRIEDALRPRLGPTEADLSGPGLLAVARGRVDAAEVTGHDVAFGRITGASVDLSLHGVTTAGDGRATVASVRGRITVPAGAVRASLAAGDRALPVGAVTTDPASGTLRLGLGPGGAATVVLRPELRDGRLSFDLAEATLLGRPAPERLVGAVREELAAAEGRRAGPGGADAALPGLRAEAARVTDRGVEVTVRGTDLHLAPPSGGLA